MKKSMLIAFFLLSILSRAKNNQGQEASWSTSPFNHKVFVENKGQFDNTIANNSDKILFSACLDGVEMLFSAKGLTYKHDELITVSEEEKEKEESKNDREEEPKFKSVPEYLSVEWIGSNPNVQIISEEPVSFYYTYG